MYGLSIQVAESTPAPQKPQIKPIASPTPSPEPTPDAIDQGTGNERFTKGNL